MTLSNAIRQKIVNLADENNISVHKLVMQSGLAYSTVSSFLNNKSDSVTMATILHLCEGANITVKEFFSDPIFKDIDGNKSTRKR